MIVEKEIESLKKNNMNQFYFCQELEREEDYVPLAEALRQNKSMQSASLANLCAESVEEVLGALENHPNLSRLKIGHIPIGSISGFLSSWLRRENCKITHLTLEHPQMSLENLTVLMEDLRQNSRLEKFVYFEREIKIPHETMVETLVRLIKRDTLQELAFPLRWVTLENMRLIIQALQNSKNLTSFSFLVEEKLPEGCGFLLSEFIRTNTPLRNFEIGDIKKESEIDELIESLRENDTLLSVSIDNRLSYEQLRKLSSVLDVNKSLTNFSYDLDYMEGKAYEELQRKVYSKMVSNQRQQTLKRKERLTEMTHGAFFGSVKELEERKTKKPRVKL